MFISIDNLHVRLIFDLGKKKVNSRKELIKISKVANFQALQHFATKFCNFTNFIMFFATVMFDSLPFPLLRLKFSLTCKLSMH
jgi:hypothetical protein